MNRKIENLFKVLISRNQITNKIINGYKKKIHRSNTCLNETDKIMLSARVRGLPFYGIEFSMGNSTG
jgi:hypothetical protein